MDEVTTNPKPAPDACPCGVSPPCRFCYMGEAGDVPDTGDIVPDTDTDEGLSWR